VVPHFQVLHFQSTLAYESRGIDRDADRKNTVHQFIAILVQGHLTLYWTRKHCHWGYSQIYRTISSFHHWI